MYLSPYPGQNRRIRKTQTLTHPQNHQLTQKISRCFEGRTQKYNQWTQLSRRGRSRSQKTAQLETDRNIKTKKRRIFTPPRQLETTKLALSFESSIRRDSLLDKEARSHNERPRRPTVLNKQKDNRGESIYQPNARVKHNFKIKAERIWKVKHWDRQWSVTEIEYNR